ncbi:MAG: cytochrome c peroxidase [Polyangiaceae bacterium]|nr:cytochrome c peroxidase [Polyangiaceae bacterium]
MPRAAALALALGFGLGCGETPDAVEGRPWLPADVAPKLIALSPAELPPPPPDVTNGYADDPRAQALGQKLFFDPRFSGPLLDRDNTGAPGTLGLKGEVGKVACASCHDPRAGFSDVRSPRRQISLASGWTRRRSPALLDFGQASVLNWDGRHDTAYNQVFGVIESPLEFNSSRLFVAQQIIQFYKDEYEAIFGPLPDLSAYAPLGPEDAGCATMPSDPMSERCLKPGHDDDAVIRVVVNMGKAIGAYERLLTCGPSRFDAWVNSDPNALTAEEQAGAALFVHVGCDDCHAGPYLTDQRFYNVGAANHLVNFIAPFDDPGAAMGISAARADRLNASGPFSDGDDGRLEAFTQSTEELRGAFRTPTLRCVSGRPSFLHAGQLRSLEDAVAFFNRGGDPAGFQGVRDTRMVPLGLNAEQRAQLVAFLRALDGQGPPPELLEAP